jgi:hypothetical protein
MKLRISAFLQDVSSDDCSSVLAGPEKVQIAMRNQNCSRELRARVGSKSDLLGIVKVPQDTSLGDSPKQSVIASPRIKHFSPVVDKDFLQPTLAVESGCDIDQDRLANQAGIKLDTHSANAPEIEPISMENLNAFVIYCFEQDGILAWSTNCRSDNPVGLER